MYPSDYLAIEAKLHGWMQASMQGDALVYAELLRALAQLLRNYFRKRMQAWPDEVEDLVQETLLAVHSKRHTYRVDQPLTAWVYAIARYKWIDFLRHRKAQRVEQLPMDDVDEWTLEMQGATGELSHALHDLGQLLALLPEKQRAAIVHTKLEGLSVTQAALATGQSESAIKVNVHRGLMALVAKVKGKKYADG